ncbi:peroxiredoxin [Acetobacter fallax]|uniref:thioredoxin-dependent peroxiredoxin n=1 Tax=Acetobacter fallax TaxID=1737473 RepID=A0ABX0K5X2_9PROT|nr:peroxiredoxin [Acetobacter fallax]NHO31779.1 redoxin domain-containing protein [Acetobacter fallax]NHO35459.1 redoxin domain-containing protein [Acetobacter fallax]
MKKRLVPVFFSTVLLLAGTQFAHAELPVGKTAPPFTLQASMGGKDFRFSLADTLKKGPVVLYFYPAAFTPGCTIEAHDFAEAMDEFHALGANVIGVSTDDIEKLRRFSVSECRSKFPVAADPDGSVSAAYDSKSPGGTHASRTSYVIAPGGRILMSYTDRSPDEHVRRTLAALHAWKDARKP